jgi:uncharacterized protein (TIGR02266 family)
MSQERRVYPRAKIKWPVKVKTDKETMDGVTSDINPNGVFIHCNEPLKLNVVFEMAITIPNSKNSLTAQAEVVWSNKWGPDDEISPRGMGVRFVNLTGKARQFIARAVMNNLESKGVAPELLQTLQTLVTEIDESKSQAA